MEKEGSVQPSGAQNPITRRLNLYDVTTAQTLPRTEMVGVAEKLPEGVSV